MHGRGAIRYLTTGVLLVAAVLIGGNVRSLAEGVSYLRHMLAWDPRAGRRIDPKGEFAICHDLVGLPDAGRHDLIVRSLRDAGLAPVPVAIPGEALPNLLLTFGEQAPVTLFVTHYDKSGETATYQGASDNTAGVCALLAAARDLSVHPPARPVAFLCSAAEERGLKGTRSFVDWSRVGGLRIAEVINFDMIGRGKLASRPSALPGFYFWLPGLGEMVYDGRGVRRGAPYSLPESSLLARLEAVLGGDLVVYRRFTAYSDSNVFQDAGWPTVSLSSDDVYYLDRVWERDADRIDLLDEDNLALARRFVVDYTRR